MMSSASFNALGKPLPSTALSFGRMIVVYVPLATLLNEALGYIGIFIATALSNAMFGIISWRWFAMRLDLMANQLSLNAHVKRKESVLMFQRRLLTLSGLVLLTTLAIVLLPLVVIITLIMSLMPKFRTTPQALTFIYGFLGHEWAGLARFLFVLIRYPKHEHMDKNRDIQFWWAQSLFNMGKRLYQLRIDHWH